MESSEARSESPVMVCKTEEFDTNEGVPKKKSQRIKQKLMDKDMMVDSTVNGSDVSRPEIEEKIDESVRMEFRDSNGFENGHYEVTYQYTFEKSMDVPLENGTSSTETNNLDATNEESNLNLEESTTGSDGTIPVVVDGDTEEERDDKENCNGVHVETTSIANNVAGPAENCNSEETEEELEQEKSEAEINGVSGSAVNGQEINESGTADVSGLPVNGSEEDSFYETVELAKEVEESPGTTTTTTTTTQNDNSFTHKISSFLGKWQTSSPLKEPKHEAEGSSSRKEEKSESSGKPTVPHPYLSKVTGRRGIKTRSNIKGVESETPKNKGPALSDSFRVKTDPPRLSQAETSLESILRKYKGKRCLNVNDDEDDEENGYGNGEDVYPTTTKRRKLDHDKSSGFLGNMLWSPFRKKPDEKAVAQSKLSRFLSPFWFWKKTVTDHERN